MLDRAFSVTLRDLSTYFLIAATLFIPLQVGYSFAFREVIEVRAIHDDISELPAPQQIRGVSSADLTRYRITGWALVAVELLALPLLVGASASALQTRARGELASVTAAWIRAPRLLRGSLAGLARPRTAVPAALAALAIIAATQLLGSLLVDPLSPRFAWAGTGLAAATARSLGTPFLVVPLAWMARSG